MPPLSTASCPTQHLKSALYSFAHFVLSQAHVFESRSVRAAMARAPKRPAQPASGAAAPGQRRRMTQSDTGQSRPASNSDGRNTPPTYADTVRGGSPSTPPRDGPDPRAALSSAPSFQSNVEEAIRQGVVRGAAAPSAASGAARHIEGFPPMPAAAPVAAVDGGSGEQAAGNAAAPSPGQGSPRASTRRGGKSLARPACGSPAIARKWLE